MFHVDVDSGHSQIMKCRLDLLHHDWSGADKIMSAPSMNRNVSLQQLLIDVACFATKLQNDVKVSIRLIRAVRSNCRANIANPMNPKRYR